MRRCFVLLVEDTSSFGKTVCNKGTTGVFIAERWIDSFVDVVSQRADWNA